MLNKGKLQGHLFLIYFRSVASPYNRELKGAPHPPGSVIDSRVRLAISANSLRFAMQMLRQLCVLYLNLAKGTPTRANKRSQCVLAGITKSVCIVRGINAPLESSRGFKDFEN